MRRTSKLRQGHTIYIAHVYWDAELKFFYGKVNTCFVASIKTIDGIDYARYKSNELFCEIPLIEGYIHRNYTRTDTSAVYFTKNRALAAVRHRAMLLNFYDSKLRQQND